ncbi:MAG: hypothetical protein LBQ40_01730 [Clostridiales bacterium]|jgi:hypothetical protein|nr:hypothetical protein [Clostridiales bacterium]
MKKMPAKKIFFILTVIFFVGLFMLFTVFAAEHGGHECADGGDCPVCALIGGCRELLEKVLGGGRLAAYSAVFLTAFLIVRGFKAALFSLGSSLFYLKTRLNN